MPSGPVSLLLEVETDQVPKVVGEIAPSALIVANTRLCSAGRDVKLEVPGEILMCPASPHQVISDTVNSAGSS